MSIIACAHVVAAAAAAAGAEKRDFSYDVDPEGKKVGAQHKYAGSITKCYHTCSDDDDKDVLSS